MTNDVAILSGIETELKSVTRFGRFTIAEIELKQSDRTVVGIGIARRGDHDKHKQEIGDAIAIARAKRAANKKMQNKRINATLMG